MINTPNHVGRFPDRVKKSIHRRLVAVPFKTAISDALTLVILMCLLPIFAFPQATEQSREDRVVPERITNSEPRESLQTAEPKNPVKSDSVRPRAASEFQEFIFKTTGTRLPLFGYDLFSAVPTTFAPIDHAPVPVDYLVGPGDELVLRGSGGVDIDYRGTVDRNGELFIPRVGNIRVAGLRYGQLQPYLKTSIAKVFRNFDLTVSMGQLRSIQIILVGQAERPGSYTVGSLSTLVDALFASGGPSSRGTLRQIQLRRNNQIVAVLDLYDLLLNGSKDGDKMLMSGDVIFIPSIGDVVAIEGSVNTPGIYELNGKTKLRDLLHYAGGLTPAAAGQRALLERVDAHAAKTVAEFSLDDSGMDQDLKNGDLVTINELSSRFENAITLRGNVATPGRFPWRAGMKISDLIPSRDALITRDFWQHQSDLVKAQRRANTYIPVTPVGTIGPEKSLEASQNKEESNAPISELQPDNPTAILNSGTDVRRAGPEINWDYAVVQRFDRHQLNASLLPFNLSKAIAGGNDNPDDLSLLPGDIVTVFSQSDLEVPISKQTKFIRLEGEFNTAGVYEVQPGETLRELVKRVGGLTAQAYLYGAEFTRESARKSQQDRLDKFVEQTDREVETHASSAAQNVSSPEEAAGLTQKIESQRRLVNKLRELKATGRVVLGLSPTATDVESLPDLPLEDGDHFAVPFTPAMVGVIGAVNNETSLLYRPGRRLSYYLKKAGGGSRTADKGHIFVIRADGSVAGEVGASRWFAGNDDLRLMPGDTVVVPEKLEATTILKGLRDWSLVFGQLLLGAAAVHTLTN